MQWAARNGYLYVIQVLAYSPWSSSLLQKLCLLREDPNTRDTRLQYPSPRPTFLSHHAPLIPPSPAYLCRRTRLSATRCKSQLAG